jgi:hypothetical protein
MLTRTLGSWQIADNTCTATLVIDRPRSINITFEWRREPGPTENEHLNVILPDIVASALEALEEYAAFCQATLGLIGDGKVCRIGIRDGLFIYAATHQERPRDSIGYDDTSSVV